MHTLVSLVKHRGFITSTITDHKTIIDDSTVYIHRDADTIAITISSKRKTKDSVEKLHFEILYIMFLILGSFPLIVSIHLDNTEKDLQELVGMYASAPEYYKTPYRLGRIEKDCISQKSIDAMQKINQDALLSFAYIKSQGYVGVVANHKTTLLFHVIEGISTLTKQEIKSLNQGLIKKYSIPANQQPGEYMAIVYDLTKKYFFGYHREYNCEILQQLNCNQKLFLQTISDTRNQYSHLRISKNHSLNDGRVMQFYNEIVSLMIRLNVLERLSISVDTDNIKELLYSIRDWIVETKYGECKDPKSISYINQKQLADLSKTLRNLNGNGSAEDEGMN